MDLTSSVLSVITPENNYAMSEEMHHADSDTHKVLKKDIET